MDEIPFGQPLPDLAAERLRFAGSRALLAACQRHPDVVVRELRQVSRADGVTADGIVVDIDNRQVPVRNPQGIRAREPLLLVHAEETSLPYDVRALRSDFPILLHQNAVNEGEPVSLCLYEAPWSAVERFWTPSRFINRILWWLSRSATGELHVAGQDLEQLFYDNGLRVIIPTGFENAAADTPMQLLAIESRGRLTLRPVLAKCEEDRAITTLVVAVNRVGHPPLARLPKTLGTLADYLSRLGTDLMGPLGESISARWPIAGMERKADQRTLVLVRVPRAAGDNGNAERIDVLAALLKVSAGTLGERLGVLDRDPGSSRLFRSYGATLSGQPIQQDSWREIELDVAHTLDTTTRAAARVFSSIDEGYVEFKAVLGGLGSLGSAMFNVWLRSGWGQWTLIDDDVVAPHNLARHTAVDEDIGVPKVNVCGQQAMAIFPADGTTSICAARVDSNAADVRTAIAAAQFVVDASASLAAARNLSCANHKARTASVFLTPSGESSVLLLEDQDRQIRLLALEAQYYRAILASPWGETHLTVAGVVRPGATCRDLSFVLPAECVLLHAAILCQQVRESVASASALIRVWTRQKDGGVTTVEVPVHDSYERPAGDWTIGWDRGLNDKVQALRGAALPAETGGILVGIIDTALMRIQVVDAMPAPIDSAGTPTGFTRGTLGLEEAEAEARRCTLGAVEYVGDWHSHPPGHAAQPSTTDLKQVVALAERLDAEDIPGLIAIVGEPGAELSWTLGRSVRFLDSSTRAGDSSNGDRLGPTLAIVLNH